MAGGREADVNSMSTRQMNGTSRMADGQESEGPPDLKRQKLMSKEETASLRKEYIAPSLSLHYSKVKPLKIVYGRGQFLYDENDQPYMDCINNVTQVGHCHPRVVEAFSRQAATLGYSPFPAYELLESYTKHLLSHLPDKLNYVFFTSSGTQANDLALQIAEEVTGHSEIVVLDGAYHGHSKPLMGLSTYKSRQQKEGESGIGSNPHAWITPTPDSYRGIYRGDGAGTKYAAEVNKVIERVHLEGKRVSCFMAEAFLGCAGQVQLPEGYLKQVFKDVRQAGGLCIIDEIQTGFGRAGDYFWIFESQGVVPDIVTMGKPMGNGHPIAAVATTKEIAATFAEKVGPRIMEQYISDPVSLAVAEAVLTVIEDELQENAKEVGGYLMERLRLLVEKYDCLGDVRGYGLFIGLEVVKDKASKEPDGETCINIVSEMLLKHQIMIKEDGLDHNVIKIKPPLCFTKENADTLIKALENVIKELGK